MSTELKEKKVATKKATIKKATVKKATTKKATMKRATRKKPISDLFANYIENIKKARIASQDLVASCEKEEKSSMIINLIWEAIFDYFCRVDKDEISPTNLNTLAGVVQKLLSTAKDIPNKDKDSGSITAQALAEIEDKLNLL
ncbi:MAG: hypothetical protein R3Y46_07660 [Opitutales bacterium]